MTRAPLIFKLMVLGFVAAILSVIALFYTGEAEAMPANADQALTKNCFFAVL
ncbi:MAG: hypothetical protein AAGJ87_03615 [Pseudomonadota bacterium]